MSNSVRSHRRQPTRLPRPWDSPGKNTGVGRHFLLQCKKVKSESEVAQSYLTLSDPMNYSLPGSSIHGIFQARVLKQGVIAFSIMYLTHKLRLSACQMIYFKYLLNQQERTLITNSKEIYIIQHPISSTITIINLFDLLRIYSKSINIYYIYMKAK